MCPTCPAELAETLSGQFLPNSREYGSYFIAGDSHRVQNQLHKLNGLNLKMKQNLHVLHNI
jgi:hypothetical protein